jgi:short-subunit dehydrogenase
VNPLVAISGASYGLGASYAKEAVKRGCSVLLLARSADKMEALRGELHQLAASLNLPKPEVVLRSIDVGRDATEVGADLRKNVPELNRVSFLINNVGGRLHSSHVPWEGLALEDIDYDLDLNLGSAFVLTKLALPSILASPAGGILNIASLAANGVGFNALYSGAKAGLVGASRALKRELHMRGAHHVTVVVSMPGYVSTPLLNNASFADFVTSDDLANNDLNQFGSRFLMSSCIKHHIVGTAFAWANAFAPDSVEAYLFAASYSPSRTRPLVASNEGLAPRSFESVEAARTTVSQLRVEL